VISAQDPEARRGKHGDFYEGYLLDTAMDADSELLTALDVLRWTYCRPTAMKGPTLCS
jgi:hypothetical protein